MKIPEDETSRMLEKECPGSPDLESALANESVGSAASHPALLVDALAPLSQVLQLMREGSRGAVLVVSDGTLVGIFTERDVLMKVAGQSRDLEHTAVSQLMTVEPVTLPVDARVAFALNKMLIAGFRHIPLVDDQNRPIAVVSMRDLIDYLSNFFSRDILNLPPDPRVGFRNRDGACALREKANAEAESAHAGTSSNVTVIPLEASDEIPLEASYEEANTVVAEKGSHAQTQEPTNSWRQSLSNNYLLDCAVVFGLVFLSTFIPAGWIGGPHQGVLLGMMLGGITEVALNEWRRDA